MFYRSDLEKPLIDAKSLTAKEIEMYYKGYIAALYDYGIWNDGEQTIGAMRTPIKQIIERKMSEMNRVLDVRQVHGAADDAG